MVYQTTLSPDDSLTGIDIVGTLICEHLEDAYVLQYFKAIDKALETGRAHCSFHLQGARFFVVMERISSMRIRVKEWRIYGQNDLEMIIDQIL